MYASCVRAGSTTGERGKEGQSLSTSCSLEGGESRAVVGALPACDDASSTKYKQPRVSSSFDPTIIESVAPCRLVSLTLNACASYTQDQNQTRYYNGSQRCVLAVTRSCFVPELAGVCIYHQHFTDTVQASTARPQAIPPSALLTRIHDAATAVRDPAPRVLSRLPLLELS
jgi:hypothetical protein